MSEVPGEKSPHEVGPDGAAAYPPPYPAAPSGGGMSDDELAAALAAQTAMYTGPITIPDVNSDPSFRPAAEAVHTELPPPVPVPPSVQTPEYVARDEVAADPEPSDLDFDPAPPTPTPAPFAAPAPAPTTPPVAAAPPPVAAAPPPPVVTTPPAAAAAGPAGPPLPDDELSRAVEREAAAGSTLDAILLLENELRRRQGLAPVADAGPEAPPEEVGATFSSDVWKDTNPAGGAIPGWTEAPDPAHEGETPAEQAWLTAPPPAFVPPPLVEPPAPEPGSIDPATLTPPPLAEPEAGTPEPHHATMVEGPDGLVDVSRFPPPEAAAAVGVPSPDTGAPPPPGEAWVLTDPPVKPELEGIDDLDRADLAAPIPVDPAGVASVAPVPVSTATMVAVGEAPEQAKPVDPSAFAVEKAALEPTPAEERAGYAARLFWLWFAANSSIVMVAVAATLFTFGMSLRQVLVAVVAGVGLSALPLGLGSLAGKWSGQPTMVVSRATFGLVGNALPAVLAIVARVLWGGVLLWLLAYTAGAVLAPEESGLGVTAIVALAAGAVLAGIVAVLGYGLLHRVQRVLGILSTLLVAATIVMTASHVDIPRALQTDDGSWMLTLGGAVLVFSVVGLAWAQSSSDLARYQRPGGSGAANMLWGSFGVIVPTLAILGWGAVLAASSPELAADLARAPLATLVALMPAGLELPLLAAAGFGLLAGAIVSMYSGGLALVSVGVRVPRATATAIAALLVALVALGLLLLGGDTRSIVTDLATTLAVPVAAWTGIFASEMMIRLRRFDAPSLLAPGGVYASVRWVNLVGLVVITGLGLGLVTAELPGLGWTGYLFPVLGVAADAPLAATDVGVLIALVLGVLLPLVAGVPAIRRQERAEREAGREAGAASLVD